MEKNKKLLERIINLIAVQGAHGNHNNIVIEWHIELSE